MKKTNKILSTIGASIILTIGTSCEKLLDINENPNQPPIEKATPEVLFPTAVMSSAAGTGGQLASVGGIWAQYFTQSATASQYKEIDSYSLTNISEEVNLSYEELYTGAIQDYSLILTKAKATNDWRYFLMATVMKAYTYQVLVDLYDQVPYTDASQGSVNIQPKFDDGYLIYTSLIAEINEALSKDFTSKEFTPGQAKTDFVFGEEGDADFSDQMANWVAFANTLKLKMYLRMVKAKPAEAEAGIKALYASNAKFLTNTAGIVDIFPGDPDRSNPFYEYNIRRLNVQTNLRASFTFARFLTENADPRVVSYYGTAAPTPIHQGDFSAPTSVQPTYPNATVFVQAATDPVHFISEAESYFMQAEALERYYGGVGAKAMYDAGVKASFAALDLDDPTDDLLATGKKYVYPTGTFEAKLKAIITQKWVSLATGSHGIEAFFEQNRTGYPAISPVYSKDASYLDSHLGELVYSANGVTGNGNFPRRFIFPEYEKNRNTNTPIEVPITTRVWWAK